MADAHPQFQESKGPRVQGSRGPTPGGISAATDYLNVVTHRYPKQLVRTSSSEPAILPSTRQAFRPPPYKYSWSPGLLGATSSSCLSHISCHGTLPRCYISYPAARHQSFTAWRESIPALLTEHPHFSQSSSLSSSTNTVPFIAFTPFCVS